MKNYGNLPQNLIEPEKQETHSLESGQEDEELISTIPSHFKKGVQRFNQGVYLLRSSSGKKKFLGLLIVLGIIFLIGVGSFIFYSWARFYLKPKTPLTTPAPVTQPAVYQSPEIKLIAEVRKSETEEVLSSAEFFLPVGALASEVIFEFKGLSLPVEMPTSTFAILDGLYKITSSVPPMFLKSAILKINYAESLVDSAWENFIKIGYFKDNLWTAIEESSLDTANNVVTTDLTSLPADTFALIVERARIEPVVPGPSIIAPQIPSSVDSDTDGLTDIEEDVYQTEKNNPDTDADSSPDGLEILNLTNPKANDSAPLALSGLINVYTNPSWSYTFFYPASWLIRALPETENRQIIIVTNTDEFFQVLVEDNNEQLSPKDWYLQKSPRVDPQTVKEETIGGLNVAWSPDGLNLYFGARDKIYIFNYNIGTETTANFKTTLQMMIKSFSLLSSESQ